MSSVPKTAVTGAGPANPRNKSFLPVFERHLQALAVDRTQPVLVVGGGDEDLKILSAVGFRQIVMSNLRAGKLNLDAEDIQLPDNSYPIVLHMQFCITAGARKRLSVKCCASPSSMCSFSTRMIRGPFGFLCV